MTADEPAATISAEAAAWLKNIQKGLEPLRDLDLLAERRRRRRWIAQVVLAAGVLICAGHLTGLVYVAGLWWRVPAFVAASVLLFELDLAIGLSWAKARRRRAERVARYGA